MPFRRMEQLAAEVHKKNQPKNQVFKNSHTDWKHYFQEDSNFGMLSN